MQRSATVEAIGHFTTAIEVLQTPEDSPARSQQELALQVTKGWAAPEAEHTYTRAQELCKQMGEIPELFPMLFGLQAVYILRAEHKRAHELCEQLLHFAQSRQDPALLVVAHFALGGVLFHLGERAPARIQLEQESALYDSQHHHSLTFSYGSFDPGVASLSYAAKVLWHLGYPEQALKRSR